MAKRAEWVDCPDEPLAVGGFVRQVSPYQGTVVYRVDDLGGDWMSVTQVKSDGTRDWRWAAGWSGPTKGYVTVRRAE